MIERPGKGPLVSVVMPTRGRLEYVKRAIESVLNQSFGNFELLVLDNSPNPEKERLREFSRSDTRIVFVDRGNIGLTEARKLGASISRGKLFSLLDSDDYWSADRLEKHIQAWVRDRIGLTWDMWEEAGSNRIREFQHPLKPGMYKPPTVAVRLYGWNFIHASAGIVSSNFAKSLGFPLLNILGSDWVLFMRAAEYYQARFIGETLSFKETGSHDRITDMFTNNFFDWEAATIRRWALTTRPIIYGIQHLKRVGYRIAKGHPSFSV
jgi:glycosyltransferase involved in cell wall biosynthesis